jgi:hypothetical protein
LRGAPPPYVYVAGVALLMMNLSVVFHRAICFRSSLRRPDSLNPDPHQHALDQ